MVIEARKMAEENAISSGAESENDRPSSENTTIIAETFSDAPCTTLSSVKSENSTEQLISKAPQINKSKVKQESKTGDAKYKDGVAIEKSRHSPDTCSKSMLTSLQSDISIREQSERRKSKLILFFGIGQLLVGVGMVITGGLVMVHGAALGKSGAGFWSGCVAIITGVMGVLGGINDFYGLYERQTSRMGNLFLTLFLALSLVSLAAGNLAAVLAGTGLLRDVRRNQDEVLENFWPPILSNIGLLLTSVIHCFIALFSIYHTAKRVCSCFRPREPFNHNQFDPSYSNTKTPFSVVSVSEKRQDKSNKYCPEAPPNMVDNRKELSKILEGKLVNSGSDTDVTDGGPHNQNHNHRRRDGQRTSQEHRRISGEAGHDAHCVGSYFGSANSKDRLVCSWLGGQPAIPMRIQKIPRSGVRKNKMKASQVLLVPANAGNTLNRPMPMPMVPVSAGRMGYATLPMVPAGPQPPMLYPHHHPHAVYPAYPINDMVRIKRKRYSGSSSPRTEGGGGRRRGNQLTRSLERIHRQRRAEGGNTGSTASQHQHRQRKNRNKPMTEADVIRTYTGLDRTIAEQFIVACDESRHSQVGSPDHTVSGNPGKSDSSGFDTASSGKRSNKY